MITMAVAEFCFILFACTGCGLLCISYAMLQERRLERHLEPERRLVDRSDVALPFLVALACFTCCGWWLNILLSGSLS